MFHRPQDVLRRLTDPTAPTFNTLDLHATLYRLCEAHAGKLNDMIVPATWKRFAQTDQDWQHYGSRWLERVKLKLTELAGTDTRELLTGCSGILRMIDRYHHRELRTLVEHQILELPPQLGGGRTAFLPPPEDPIARQVPEERRLARRRGHQKHDLREILGLWWNLMVLDRSGVIPRFIELKAAVSDRLKVKWDDSGDLLIALASPLGHLEYDFYSDPSRCDHRKGTPYRFVGLKGGLMEEAQGAIDRVLDDCASHGVDVLCFPELTLDRELLEYLRQQLASRALPSRPAFIVTGSFHLEHEEGSVNRCHVLDGYGEELFTQDKCKGFEITPQLASEMGSDLCAMLGIDERGGFEEIQSSDRLVIADCALGRLITPICLDFSGDELRQLFLESQTNLLLVPAMTPRMGDFVKRAYKLGTMNRSTTFVVNSSWLVRQSREPDSRDLFIGYVPAKGKAKGQPVEPDGDRDWALFSIRELLSNP